MKKLSLFFFFAACSVISPKDAELLRGTWLLTEQRVSGATTVQVDNVLVLGADGVFTWTVTQAGAAPVASSGSYKAGYYAPRQALTFFNAAGQVTTEALFFYMDAQGLMVTARQPNFTDAQTWKRKN